MELAKKIILPLLLLSTSFNTSAKEAFFFGVANSAFQVEGNPVESDWTRWTQTPGKIDDDTDSFVATDFWNRYEEDFDLAAKLGVQVFRMSIAWDRLEVEEGVWDESALDHYEKMIVALRKRGLEPMITLHHFVLPAWLADKGGLESNDFVNKFVLYAEKVVARLSASPAKVRYWMTFNESMGQVAASYLSDHWPPGVFDPERATLAAANTIRAHLKAALAIRALKINGLKLGLAHNWRPFYPGSIFSPADHIIAGQAHKIYNLNYLNSITTGKIKVGFPGAKAIRDNIKFPKDFKSLDFLGINYYGRLKIRFTFQAPHVEIFEGPGPKTDMNWEIFPQGLYKVLREAHHRYKLPIVISENGLADRNDTMRFDYIRSHLDEIQKARAKGVPVLGYLHWSLTDNFEWAEGLGQKFGLVEIDYSTQQRKPRQSFNDFADLIKNLQN